MFALIFSVIIHWLLNNIIKQHLEIFNMNLRTRLYNLNEMMLVSNKYLHSCPFGVNKGMLENIFYVNIEI